MAPTFRTFLPVAVRFSALAATLILAPAFSAANAASGKAHYAAQSPVSIGDAAVAMRGTDSHLVGTSGTAQDFVLYTGIVKNLSLLLLHDVKDDVQVQAAIKRYGFDKVQNSVVKAIRLAQATHSRPWSDMLAGIYEDRFEASELKSILVEKEASPHFVKLLDQQDAIADAVKRQGKDIYAAARAQVMSQLSSALKI